MPTAAQRQRAAAAAAGAPPQVKHGQRQTGQKPQQQQPPPPEQKVASSSKMDACEDGAFSDEDSDEDEAAVAFEMDSLDLWTQNYCATCDCLIEPGQGFGAIKREQEQQTARHSPTSSLSRGSAAGLKSKSGTIKARPPAYDGHHPSVAMKRTHSAGKLHAGGAAGALGPHKRTGSAAGRLNALSELRPTTKLNGETNKPKVVGPSSESGKKSPSLSRRNSGLSDKSGANSANSSRPSSPVSPTNSLPRSKKGGLIAATLRKDEESDENKMKSMPALYCSERCRGIDEQRSSGLGELVYYLQQPASPPSTWNNSTSGSSYGAWSGNRLAVGTPESECTCAECMERSSTSGTAPSAASDTTESSTSYHYGPGGTKQRSQSGRIVTPQNLLPPGSHGADYFGIVGAASKRKSVPKAPVRAVKALFSADSASQAGTEGSIMSSDSAVSDLWEPRSKSVRPPPSRKTVESLRSKRTSSASDEAYGTTGTVTPAATISSPQRSESPSMWPTSSSLGVSQTSTSSPLRLLRRGDLHAHASVDVTQNVARSPQQYPSSLLSRSLASEYTEGAASSGVTLTVGQSSSSQLSSSLLERRQGSRFGEQVDGFRLAPTRVTDSPKPMDTPAKSAIGTLKNAQKSAVSDPSVQDGQKPYIGSTTTGNGGTNWLRASISLAWNSIRGLPPTSDPPHRGASEQDRPRRNSVSSGALSRLSATNPMLVASTPIENSSSVDDPTPTQSQIARPRSRRGDVPAFASEIGLGEIPGECEATLQEERMSKSLASANGSFDDDRRRRRMERERLQRHQRSKDVTVLPPLLGVGRTSSTANLYPSGRPPRPTYSHSSTGSSSGNLHSQAGRAKSGSVSGQSVHSSSYGTLSTAGNGLNRPITPGMRKGSSSTVNYSAIDLASSPGNRMMSVGSLGTSPRRAGLGWGAMTAIASPEATQTSTRPSSHVSHRSSHSNHPHHQNNHNQHHHHDHHHHHHQNRSLQPHNNATLHGSRHHHRSSGGSSSNTLATLGHVGLLGAHPHGHNAVYGRHSTTPVRSSTPRVPEDGGEMSGAALKGELENDVDQGLPQRQSFIAPPSRPHSVMATRTFAPTTRRTSSQHSQLEHQRNMSSDDVQRAKMYPVLDVPNRQPTHDRYDSGWNLDERGMSDLLSNKEQAPGSTRHPVPPQARQVDPSDAPRPHRKRLFYFDTT